MSCASPLNVCKGCDDGSIVYTGTILPLLLLLLLAVLLLLLLTAAAAVVRCCCCSYLPLLLAVYYCRRLLLLCCCCLLLRTAVAAAAAQLLLLFFLAYFCPMRHKRTLLPAPFPPDPCSLYLRTRCDTTVPYFFFIFFSHQTKPGLPPKTKFNSRKCAPRVISVLLNHSAGSKDDARRHSCPLTGSRH